MSGYLKLLAKQYSVPKYLFDSILEYCNQNYIVRPSYSIVQNLISVALNNEKTRINNKLYNIMDNSSRKSVDLLLEKDDLFYHLTLIRQDQKDFTTSEIRANVEKHKSLVDIYSNAVTLIKQLDISEQNIIHYAELSERYTIYGLRNLKPYNLARLYILCYVYHRFLKINDYLILSLIYNNFLRKSFYTNGFYKNYAQTIFKRFYVTGSKSNDTLRALIELDKIVMSDYMLNDIEKEEIQKAVYRSLNRGESYHQLRSAIAKVSGKKLTGKTEAEIIISNECARFLALYIIFYNACILSRMYESYKEKGMLEKCKEIAQFSPVAWQHINLIGKYEFLTNVEILNLEKMVTKLISLAEEMMADEMVKQKSDKQKGDEGQGDKQKKKPQKILTLSQSSVTMLAW